MLPTLCIVCAIIDPLYVSNWHDISKLLSEKLAGNFVQLVALGQACYTHLMRGGNGYNFFIKSTRILTCASDR